MKRSYRMAFAGLAALLCSSTASLAQGNIIPPGTVVSALSQSEIKSVLREIRSGTPVPTVLARYGITAEELQQLQQLATRLGIDDVQDLRQEVRSIVRDLRSGTSLQKVLSRYNLTVAELERLADRFGFEDLVDRVTDRAEKAAGKAEKKAAKRDRMDDDETTGSTRGASRFAPGQLAKDSTMTARDFAPGQRARETGMNARDFAPGQQMQNDMQSGGTTGSISTGMDRSNSGARGLDRADQVAGSNGQDGRSDAREAMGGSSGNPGGEQSGGKGSDNGKGSDGDKSK